MMEQPDDYTQLLERYRFPGQQPWVRPAYDGYSILNLVHSLLAHYGAGHDTPLAFHAAFANALRGRRKIMFLLVDGLGWSNLEGVRTRPAVDELVTRAVRWPLTSMYPSTTTTVTASYLSGLTAAQHGMLGFSMYFPEYGRPFNMLSFRALEDDRVSLHDLGFHPEQFIGHPTILARLNEVGILARAYVSERYAYNGLSQITYHDCMPYAFNALGDLIGMSLDQLHADIPQFLFAYWSFPDSIAHVHGWQSASYFNEVEMLASVIQGQMLPRMDDDTALLVCADHGHMDGNDAEAIDLMVHHNLLELFRDPPAGEGMGLHLFLRPGTETYARELLRMIPGLTVLTREEFLQSRLLGEPPYHPGLQQRVGELLLFPHGSRRILYSYQQRPHTAMVGRHGGMMPEQMIVPLLIF